MKIFSQKLSLSIHLWLFDQSIVQLCLSQAVEEVDSSENFEYIILTKMKSSVIIFTTDWA